MSAYQQKPKTIGSAYINLKKGSSDADFAKLDKIIDALKNIGAYFSISMKKANEEGYVKMSGFMNGFKKSEKDPDIVIRMSEVAAAPVEEQTPSRQAPRRGFNKPRQAPPPPAPVKKEDEFGGEEFPF